MNLCSYCGTPITPGSNTCPNCGAPFVAKPKVQTNPPPLKVEPPKKKKHGLAKFIVVIIILIAGFNIVRQNLTRPMESGDYLHRESDTLSSYTITITPLVKVKNCMVTITIYSLLTTWEETRSIMKSNLSIGEEYDFRFDFSLATGIGGYRIQGNIEGVVYLF